MHYKLKALQKVMKGVADEVDSKKRPVLEKFREIADAEPSEELLSRINTEVDKIKTIIDTVKNDKSNNVADKIKEAMEDLDVQIVEALNLYLTAWEVLRKIKVGKTEEQVIEENYEEVAKALDMAEKSEKMIMEIEVLMADVLNENPVDM